MGIRWRKKSKERMRCRKRIGKRNLWLRKKKKTDVEKEI